MNFAGLNMPTYDTRRDQMFPQLNGGGDHRIRRFGEVRHYAAGEQTFTIGEVGPGVFVIIDGITAARGAIAFLKANAPAASR
jgi:hypothetical protein